MEQKIAGGRRLEPHGHANPLVRAVGKLPENFTRKDLLKFIQARGIRSIHFRYPAKDGKLKELKLPVNGLHDAEAILAEGERVDGSSLFKGMVDPGQSDMYVLPVYRTAFLDPFQPDCLAFLCRYLDGQGRPAEITPDNVLARADERFRLETGCELAALGELEFYLVYPDEANLYPGKAQGAYHEASPFVKWDDLCSEFLRLVSESCGGVKYCHSEVGCVESSPHAQAELRGKRMSQYELEFLPAPLQDAAGRILVSKWILRNLAARRGILATFAPKLTLSDAATGLHVHLALGRGGKNALIDSKGSLTQTAFSAIGGLLRHAGSLTAFGNTCAASYLRLVPHQEAPVRVCWSSANRSALIRVPLGWRGVGNLATRVNPRQPPDFHGEMFGQTVEIRSPDGSADVHLLLAGLAAAVRDGLSRGADSAQAARRLEVSSNVFNDPKALSRLESLPRSCWESAQLLKSDRAVYEGGGVFPPAVVDFCVRRLEEEEDQDLARKLALMPPRRKEEAALKVMAASLHCM